jgi:hypothetical protein
MKATVTGCLHSKPTEREEGRRPTDQRGLRPGSRRSGRNRSGKKIRDQEVKTGAGAADNRHEAEVLEGAGMCGGFHGLGKFDLVLVRAANDENYSQFRFSQEKILKISAHACEF